MTIKYATIEWREYDNGQHQPYSVDFNDVYFNSEDGLAEAQYVFIDKNDLINRFKNLQKPVFTILETGFGTGLNCYTVVNCWLKYAPKTAKLRYFSIEKLPLTFVDMQRASQLWPQFSNISNEFLSQYTNIQSCLQSSLQFPRSIFSIAESRIDIGLWLGDINHVLPNLQISDENWPESGVDTFLLDGFAPAKNIEMWQHETLSHLARLSNAGSTFATFTSASSVRKNLEKIGFHVQKYPGFGKKREMLAGYYSCSVK